MCPYIRTHKTSQYSAVFGSQVIHSISMGALRTEEDSWRRGEESNEHQPTPCPPPHYGAAGLGGVWTGLLQQCKA